MYTFSMTENEYACYSDLSIQGVHVCVHPAVPNGFIIAAEDPEALEWADYEKYIIHPTIEESVEEHSCHVDWLNAACVIVTNDPDPSE